MNQFRKNQSQTLGFTLVEMLVYLGLFVTFSAASVGLLFSLSDLVDQYRIETMLYRSGTNAMEQMLLSIRQADTVDLFNTVEDNPLFGKLTVENAASSTSFTRSGSGLEMAIDGATVGNLVSDDVTVASFTVYYYEVDGHQFVRVYLSLVGDVNGVSKVVNFYGGAVVRGAL